MQRPGVLFGVCVLFVCIVVVVAWPRHHRIADTANLNSVSNDNTTTLTNAVSAASSIDDEVPNASLPDLTGNAVSIAAESDHALTVVALWNTRCTSCIAEVVAMNPLVKKYANRITFIALDRGDAPSVAQTAATDKAFASQVLIDETGGQAVITGDAGTPTFYLVRNHTIDGVGIGPLTTDQIETKITQVLAVE